MFWFNSPSRKALRQPKTLCATRVSTWAGGGYPGRVWLSVLRRVAKFVESGHGSTQASFEPMCKTSCKEKK